MIVAQLAHHPALAHVYVWTTYHAPVTVRHLQTELDRDAPVIQRHVDTLADLGVVRVEDCPPLEVTGIPVRVRTDTLGLITPTMVHAVSRQTIDADIAGCVDAYGVQTLLAAVRQAGRYHAGQIPKRTVADPLGIPVSETRQLVDALGRVLAAGHAHDPHFADLFPAIADHMADLDTVATEGNDPAGQIPI